MMTRIAIHISIVASLAATIHAVRFVHAGATTIYSFSLKPEELPPHRPPSSRGGKGRGRLPPPAAFASPSIPPPPPISVPVWSLAAPMGESPHDDAARRPTETGTSMNIVTFATPVSVAPPKLWVVSLYTDTLTRRAFLDSKVGVLQLLTPEQKVLVPILGKRSGYEGGFSKRGECAKLDKGDKFRWVSAAMDGESPSDALISKDDGSSAASMDLLPGCASYIKLKLLSVIQAGDHDVALCEVAGTGVWNEEFCCIVQDFGAAASVPRDSNTVLYTGLLRSEGII